MENSVHFGPLQKTQRCRKNEYSTADKNGFLFRAISWVSRDSRWQPKIITFGNCNKCPIALQIFFRADWFVGLTNFCFLAYQIRTHHRMKLVPRNCFLAQFVLMCIAVEETGWHLMKLRCLCHHFPYFFGCSTPRFIISIILSAFYYSFLPSSLSSPAATPGIIKIKTSEILQHTQPKIKTLTWATERNYAKRLALYFATIYLRMTVFHNFIIPTWHRNFMLLTLTLKIEHQIFGASFQYHILHTFNPSHICL